MESNRGELLLRNGGRWVAFVDGQKGKEKEEGKGDALSASLAPNTPAP